MIRLWLTLTLFFAACSASHHSGGDAGSDPDGAICRPEPTFIRSLDCPGEVFGPAEAIVRVSAGIDTCCASILPDVRSTRAADGTFVLSATGRACDCCDACRCAGPSVDVQVSLGALDPGTYTVTADGESCSFRVLAPSECHPTTIDELRMPAVAIADQSLARSFITNGGGGCSCGYRVTDTGSLQYDAALCGCCEECGCVDLGYESAIVGPAPAVGEHTIRAGELTKALSVFNRTTCNPSQEVTAVRVVPPQYDQSGHHWAIVQGLQTVCCADPTPAIDRVGTTDRSFELEALHCEPDPCDCVGKPQPFEAWHSLGPLESGSYSVSIRDVTMRFDVP